PHEKAERDLSRRRALRDGDLVQDAAALRAWAGEAPVTERAVGDHDDPVRLAPREHRVLDRALPEMVKDLVTDDAAVAGDRANLDEVRHVEVAHAPREDLALALELLEGSDGVFEWVLSAPVQEVDIQAVGAQTGERALAGHQRPAPRGMLG